MEPADKAQKQPVGRFGVIHLQLAPEIQTEEQRAEINDLLLWLMSLCNEKERADQSPEGTIRHLTAIHCYYNSTEDRRALIDQELRKAGLDHGVENMLRVVYRNAAKPATDVPTLSEQTPTDPLQAQAEIDAMGKALAGGTPQYSDIIGFMSYNYDPFQDVSDLFIGHVFITEPYRKQRVCGAMLRNLISSFAHSGVGGDNTATPLFKADVPAGNKAALKLFMSTGFRFSRQPVGGHDPADKDAKQPLRIEQAEVMDDIIRKSVNSSIASPGDTEASELVFTLAEHYHMYNVDTDSYRMTHVLGCCHTCKSTTVPLEKLSRCVKCHAALYCNAVCQKADWKQRHKLHCHDFRL